ncbi:uncharacterized protein [Nicotiana sylvestris]|uniref:uncharacterized protein n=1 Tax=Nicotiana sylvestris TaxID=4096 RepID=UPI00388C4973
MTRPLPNLNQAYAMIINIESQRITGKNVYGSNDNNEVAAMMSNRAQNSGHNGGSNNSGGYINTGYSGGYKPKNFFNKSTNSELFSGKVLEIGREELGLYILKAADRQTPKHHISPSVNTIVSTNKNVSLNNTSPCNDFSLWHRRLGYAPLKVLQKLQNLYELHLTDNQHCTLCPISKQSRLSFPLRTICSTSIFDLVHADVWGPYRLSTHDSKRYFLTLADDFSKYIWIFLLTAKANTVVVLKNFLTMVSNQFKTTVKCLRTDNGTEFVNDQVHSLLQSLGILYQSSYVYTPPTKWGGGEKQVPSSSSSPFYGTHSAPSPSIPPSAPSVSPELSSDYRASLAAYSVIVKHRTFKEASAYPKWIEAMQAEISALQDNNTWFLVDFPQGKVPIWCKRVFKVKYKSNGEVERYKARLMDVHNAFLQGDLLEEVYMQVPDGFSS